MSDLDVPTLFEDPPPGTTDLWDVRTTDGTVVGTLPELATALAVDEDEAAKSLLGDPVVAAAAPEGLQIEAKARVANLDAKAKGGGNQPPPIANGSFVSWGGKKGKVDLIVTNGSVPGVEGDVQGTAKTPAARVVIYEDDKATTKKVGVSTHTLKRIPPLGRSRPPGQKALVAILARHETACDATGAPEYARVTGEAVKTVYDRGLDSYPGEAAVALDRPTWAIERVGYFVKVAAGEETEKPGNDADLLDPKHPLFKPLQAATPPPGTTPVDPPPGTTPVVPEEGKAAFMGGADHVTLDRQAVDDELAELMDGIEGD